MSMRVCGVAAVALLAAAATANETQRTLPRSGLRPCTLRGLDAARCGFIDVPESRDDPTARTIPIRVVVVPAVAPAPAADPVLFLVGGPGQGAAELAAPLAERLSFLRDTRDLVFVDQRGTGASHRLGCPPPDQVDDLMGRIFVPQRLADCRDHLARRADLRRYTTTAAALDYETVLEALDYRQVNVWGVSYGTRLALEIARRLPHRVRTLVLEAAVPTSFAWPTFGARDLDAAIEALIGDCEADARCAARHRSLRRDVHTAFAALATAPHTTPVLDPQMRNSVRVRFAATDLAYATRGMLYGFEAVGLPGLFRAAAARRYEGFAQAYVTRARTLGQQLATGVHLGVYCAEDLPFVDVDHARKLSASTRIGTYLLDEYERACAVWPRAPVTTDFREPVRSAVPTLIFAGRRDPVTPPWTAHAVAKTLTRGRVLTWAAGGHAFDGLKTRTCKEAIVRQFVTTGRTDDLPVDCMSREAAWPLGN